MHAIHYIICKWCSRSPNGNQKPNRHSLFKNELHATKANGRHCWSQLNRKCIERFEALTLYDKYTDTVVLRSHHRHLNLPNILHILPWHLLKRPLQSAKWKMHELLSLIYKKNDWITYRYKINEALLGTLLNDIQYHRAIQICCILDI